MYRLIILLVFAIARVTSSRYIVHMLDDQYDPIRNLEGNLSSMTKHIYCYGGTNKNLLSIWQTVRINIKTTSNDFTLYLADNPEQVYNDYIDQSNGWSMTFFRKKPYRSISVDLYTTTCMAIDNKSAYVVELQVQRVDLWRVLTMFLGVALIWCSRLLSGNSIFFYLCGIFVGTSASFMVLVYYISKLLPRKTLTYGLLIGGWTVGVYLFQQAWENIHSILITYQVYLFWYTLIISFVSFLICYRIGPPKNQRSMNIVMWTLQIVGALIVFFSSQYEEGSGAVAVATIVARYTPLRSLIVHAKAYWIRRYPPKPRLLTNEEYYEQGARETKHALDNLRKYCSSPDCAQWSIMLKLNDSKRFASFVEGNSHLSDDEILGYETYAFSVQSTPTKPIANSTKNHLDMSNDISSDDSDYDD